MDLQVGPHRAILSLHIQCQVYLNCHQVRNPTVRVVVPTTDISSLIHVESPYLLILKANPLWGW